MTSTCSRIVACVVPALFLTIASPQRVTAEPVVFGNTSYIFGSVMVLQNGTLVLNSSSFDTSVSTLPNTWTLTDTRTISSTGGAATVATSVNGALTSSGFTGGGAVQQNASVPASTELTAQSWGRSVWNVSFQLDRPYSFAYSGTYTADSDGTFGALVGQLSPLDIVLSTYLPPLFTDRFQYFSGSRTETTHHAGLLPAGYYNLTVLTDPLYVTAPGMTYKNSGYAFRFDLTPVPEPASLLLIGVGLAGIASRKLSRAMRWP